MDVAHAVGLYASGLFPMDSPDHARADLPWWTTDPRTILELDEDDLETLRRKVRRSLRAGEGWELRRGTVFADVVDGCSRARSPEDGVWISRDSRSSTRTSMRRAWRRPSRSGARARWARA